MRCCPRFSLFFLVTPPLRKEIKEIRKEKEDEQSMRMETRLVISGDLVPTAKESEDTFKIAADIMKEISGEEILKNQVGVRFNTSLAAPWRSLTVCKIQNGRQVAGL